jgi:CRP/FNR family cyclic AMP-dependent transcriptional regulator
MHAFMLAPRAVAGRGRSATGDGQDTAMIEGSSLFKGLPSGILDKIAKLRVRRRLAPGEVLFRKGDPGDALYGVMAGRLHIHANAIDGRDALLNIMGPGDIFGEIALIDGLPRTADATAIDKVDLMMLRRAEFLELLRRENELTLHLLGLTCRRLRWLSDMVEDATFLSAPARLAKRLLHLAEQNGEKYEGGIRINLRLSQRAVGELAGLSRETTNKYLRSWVRLGWITLRRETIVLRQLQPLQDLADTDSGEMP